LFIIKVWNYYVVPWSPSKSRSQLGFFEEFPYRKRMYVSGQHLTLMFLTDVISFLWVRCSESVSQELISSKEWARLNSWAIEQSPGWCHLGEVSWGPLSWPVPGDAWHCLWDIDIWFLVVESSIGNNYFQSF
jgi:hypothetical protein